MPHLTKEDFKLSEIQKTPRLQLKLGKQKELIAKKDGKEYRANVKLCFPWSQQERFYVLQNEKGEEIASIDDANSLDQNSRRAFDHALIEESFVIDVTRIDEIKDDYELRLWEVKSVLGLRRFQTKLDEWPQRLSNGDLIVRDVSGDIYRIRSETALDKKSQKLLWAYADLEG